MSIKISGRLMEVVDALPLHDHIRVLEIGCGPGAAARELVSRVNSGYVLGIDRSAKAIQQAINSSPMEIAAGRLAFRCMAAESLELQPDDLLFDIAFAIRVGALDGRHPHLGQLALPKISRVLKKGGRFFIDGGDPLQEVDLSSFK